MDQDLKPEDLVTTWAWSKGHEHDSYSETRGKFLKLHPELLDKWEASINDAILNFFEGKGKWSCTTNIDTFVNAVVYAKNKDVKQYINGLSKSLGEFIIYMGMFPDMNILITEFYQKKMSKHVSSPRFNHPETEHDLPEQFAEISFQDIVRALGIAAIKGEYPWVYRLSEDDGDIARSLGMYFLANPNIHEKMKCLVNKRLPEIIKVEDDEIEDEPVKKLKVPKNMTEYFQALINVLNSWGENVEQLLKLSDNFHRLESPTKKVCRIVYEKSVEMIVEILQKHGLNSTGNKKVPLGKIRDAIATGTANCISMRNTASDEFILDVTDELMTIQIGFAKLQKLVDADIAVPIIKSAIWKKVIQLNNAFSKVFARMI